MNIPLIDLKAQYEEIKKEIQEAISKVLEKQNFILGENVEKLEEEIARYCNVKYAVGVASGTDALILSLVSLGIKEGNEVITTPFTFFATAEAISKVRAKPVFVDIDERTFNINPELIEEKITEKTRAIIPVHLFGQMADMKKINEIARKYNLKVIEDAAQAIGAEQKIKDSFEKAGSLSDAGCFSFFPSKNLGGYGDGGMVVTNNLEIAEKIKLLRVHGSRKKYIHQIIGYNSRLDEIQAAILRVKLKYLDKWNKKRRENAAIYNSLLKDFLEIPYCEDFNRHTYHLYTVKCEKRDGLQQHLKNYNINTGIYYPLSLHLQEAYKSLGYKKGDFKISEKMQDLVLSLPMYPELKTEQIEFICEKIKEFYKK